MSFIRAMVHIFSFASLNRTFYISPNEIIYTIALITIHYLYTITRMKNIHYFFI